MLDAVFLRTWRATRLRRYSMVDKVTVEEVPVTLHFQETSGIDAVVRRIINNAWVFHETGTNMFYRVNKGVVLYSRGGWLASVRAARAEFPDAFWRHVCMRSFAAAEKALADLGAAVFRADDFLFELSAARLLLGAAGFLFALNHQFEPSGRVMHERLKSLPLVPEGFIAELETFLQHEDGLSPDARRELADHMVRDLRLLGREEIAKSHSPAKK